MPAIDTLFKWLCLGCALLAGLLMLGFFLQLAVSSSGAWREFGFGFLVSREWDPGLDRYGALPGVAGTLATTLLALLFALPPAFAAALFLLDAPPFIQHPVSQAIDLLAAIPSVIYGMWGLFILVPLMQEYVQPFLADTLMLGALPLVGRDYNGFGILTAGLILGLMILPYITAVMRDVFRMTPPVLIESAHGVGCTRWEAARHILLRHGFAGILGGVFIGLGRALGETMAVLFVIGNLCELPTGIFSGATTISATLANNFAEAEGLQRSALFALGLILLFISFGIQVAAQYYLNRTLRKNGVRRA